ncbi:MAG: hypothetical protein JXR94_04250 [Candidatus Hydrogenedentes bacterium]|nr:hypothetical protein [Candidatus Hydrogenedentota bacterium]
MKRHTTLVRKALALLAPGTADCAWVRGRLAAFASCDPALSESEFDAIERHVARCSACRLSLERMDAEVTSRNERLLSSQALAPLDAQAMARRIVARGTRVRVAQAPRRSRWSAGALAAAALLLVGAPVLAFVGAEFYERLGERSASLHAGREQAEPQPGDVLKEMCLEGSGLPGEGSGAATQGPAAPGSGDETRFMAELGSEAVWCSARARIEAALPQCDEDYEVWARHEYPHIMWLYDVLRSPENRPRCGSPWQRLLVGSGESLAFDWPDAPRGPACRPRIRALKAAAAVAGVRLVLTDTGAYALPALAWADLEAYGLDEGRPIRVALEPLPRDGEGVPEGAGSASALPEGYPTLLAQNRDLAQAVFTHFLIASIVTIDELTASKSEASVTDLRDLRDEALYLLCDLAVPASRGEDREAFPARCSRFFVLREEAVAGLMGTATAGPVSGYAG